VLCRSLHYRSDHNQVRKPNSSSTSTCSINLVSTTTKLNHIIIDCDWLKKFPLNHVGLWITCLQASAVWKTVKLLSHCAVFLDHYWKQCCIKRGTKCLLLFSSRNINYNKIISMSISEICWWPIRQYFHLFFYIHRAALMGYESRSPSRNTSQKLP
jgi:hypothetical protein